MSYCATCYGFGWVPFGARHCQGGSPSNVRLLVACPCNQDRHIPPPHTPAIIAAIMDEPTPRPEGEF